MKSFNKISLIFVIIFVAGLSIFSAQKSLAADPSCTLTANPASGAAPLNNIGLTARVTGGTGNIVYRFNCNPGDGTWDHTSSATPLASYTIADLCDFSSAGTYTVKANVTRGTALAKDCLATVTVTIPTATPVPTCSSSFCNLCNFANCVSAGCKWMSSSNRCIPNITPTPTPSDYVPPAGSCPGFKANYSSDGTLAEIRSDCFGTGKAYHNVDLYAPNGYPYYITLSPEQTCYKATPPDFGEENCNNLPISLNSASDSVVAQLFSKLLSKIKNLLGDTAEALPYGHCYSPNMVCTSFYPWQIYHAEVFTTYNSDPENCWMEIQLWNKAGQNLGSSYYGSAGKMACGSPSNTQGVGGLTVNSDEVPSAKFWEHVSLDGSMFDAVQWEGYVKYWAKRVSFKNFDIQPTTINRGDSVTISWNVLNATKVYLFVGDAWCDSKVHISSPVDPKCIAHHAGAVEVGRSGSMYLYPDSSTNFYLYAYGPSGEGPQYILNGPIKVTVNETPLSCSLNVNPSTGSIPLTGVDLEATVSGSVAGNINYYFSCLNDTTWEATYLNQSATSKSATDLCSYTGAGTKNPKVKVERGGQTAECSAEVTAFDSGDKLSCNLTANPSSGSIPLTGVDLTANVSGTATGNINYYFSCLNDDTWEATYLNQSATSKSATDLCSYTGAGLKHPKARVERGGATTECSTEVTATTSSQGTIRIRTKLDGVNWTGNVGYTLNGPQTIIGTNARIDYPAVSTGSYTLSYTSGGPNNAMLDSISPTSVQQVLSGQTTVFTLNFKTISGPSHKECNASKRCVIIVGEGADTCTDDVSCGWTGDTHKECNASKRCVAVSGAGADTCTDDVSCGWTGDTHKECNASDKCVDVSGLGADQCINDTSCNLPDNGFVCNFSWSPESPKAKSAIDFFDYTQTPEGTTLTSWTWTFEDGTPASSSTQNPGSVIFNSAGEKTVTLQATNSDNDTCTFNQEITVQSLNPKWIEVIPK